MTMTTNEHESRARTAKAVQLAAAIEAAHEACGAGHDEFVAALETVGRIGGELKDLAWRGYAERAGVRPPSDATIAATLELLRRTTCTAVKNAGDPFAGLS